MTDPAFTSGQMPEYCAETPAQQRVVDFWQSQGASELQSMLPKVAEYGSYDLNLVGSVMADTIKHCPHSPEIGVVFYLLGKIARAVSAVKDGNLPSADTYHDIAIYAKMALYIREYGQWP